MKKMRVAEWNLHGMTGTGVGGSKYIFPGALIHDSISGIDCPEVVVFTEFISGSFDSDNYAIRENALKLKKCLEELGYFLIMTKPLDGRNGVCIALRKNLGDSIDSMKNMKKLCDGNKNSPDFLAVGNDDVVIFGVRFLSNEINSRIQNWLNVVSNYKDKKVIAIGDFNRSKDELINNQEFKRYNMEAEKLAGVRILRIHECKDFDKCMGDLGDKGNSKEINNKDTSDHELLDQNKFSILDHVITNFDTEVKVEYSWDFMKNIYDSVKNRATYINMRCIPDHAILIAEVEI